MIRRSHGTGAPPWAFRARGENVVIEEGCLVFHPENVTLGANVYVGHQSILKGYFKNEMVIGDNSWIGQQCFFHSAGGLFIGRNVGVAPCCRILTAQHALDNPDVPIMNQDIECAPVTIEDDCDLGIGTILLPGVTLGRGTMVGAGSVVTKSVPSYSVVAGNPARILRSLKPT